MSNWIKQSLLALIALLGCAAAVADTTVGEDFTGASTNNNWYSFTGACLTASTNAGAASGTAGQIPGCTAIKSSYYNENLVGGYNGTTGSSQTLPDPAGNGALRFTNGCLYNGSNCSSGGHSQNGVIISADTFGTSAGVQITFKTVTYRGDSGGNGSGCPAGTTYNASTNQCTTSATASPVGSSVTTYSCATGYALSGTTCTGTVAATATTTTTYSCSAGFTLSGTNCQEAATPTTTYSCPSGYTLSGTTCSGPPNPASGGKFKCPSGYLPSGNVASNTTCTGTATSSTSYSCPTGTTLSGTGSSSKCTTSAAATTTTTYSCPNGSVSLGSGAGMQCTITTAATATTSTVYYCPTGYTPTGQVTSSTTCTATVASIPDPHQNNGADGISFFLMDGSVDPNYGSWGGSLGYTCSNANPPYNGLVGAYVGLGIDEYGNFLNGTQNTLGVVGAQSLGDNTASGGGQWANRIGLRGAGNVSWSWLNANYPADYPSTLTSGSGGQQQAAVRKTCQTGYIWNYSTPSSPVATTTTVPDYGAIPNAFKVLTGVTLAKEYSTGGYARGNGTPIMYKLKLTQDGLLSLWYSVNGGSWQGVLSGQSITASNGPLPSSFRFGFAGSTGGSSNIHEVMCFQAAPATQSASSAAANEKQSAQVQTGTQAYFAFYSPDDWTGRLTANGLSYDSSGNLLIASAANWDASCVLTGVSSGSTCPTTGGGPVAAEAPSSRVMLTWSGSAGIPLEWNSLSASQQSALTAGDASANANRLNYLRGDRSNEITSSGAGLFRARNSVLGDLVDSSPVWVGPASASYPTTWRDQQYPGVAMPENSSTQTYAQYMSAKQTRQNVVYVGGDDGLVHGFRSGAFSSSNSWQSATNDGQEVIAYMPSAIVNDIHNSGTSELDYANTQYGHNFFVDATPGTGDLYYGNAWHTWLVGGLGAGGADLYALDISNPSAFSESNAASLVIGDWTPATISCANVPNCGLDLGNTYGSPLIRRMHNGNWAVIFGNGFGGQSGDAGVYVMSVDATSGAQTFYYLSTGQSGNDGIAYVTAADLDGDGVADYLYAGDLQGKVWRFDVTSSNPALWGTSSTPLFTTSSGQPITTRLMVVSVDNGMGGQQVTVAFGTGQKTALTNTSPTSYASGTQTIYSFWDWNLSAWDAKSQVKYVSLASSSAPATLGPSNLQSQTMSATSAGSRDITTPTAVCWAGTLGCTGTSAQYGWYVALPGTNEQIIYNPEILGTAFLVNSIVPANNSPLSCSSTLDTGYTYAISMVSGGAISGFFVNNTDLKTVGVQTNATGTSFVVGAQNSSASSSNGTNSNGFAIYGGPPGGSAPPAPGSCTSQVGGQQFLVYQTVSGTGSSTKVAPGCNVLGKRLTWTQLR